MTGAFQISFSELFYSDTKISYIYDILFYLFIYFLIGQFNIILRFSLFNTVPKIRTSIEDISDCSLWNC